MPRTYTLPQFNVPCRYWIGLLTGSMNTWSFTPPTFGDGTAIDAQLYNDGHDQVLLTFANSESFGVVALQGVQVELRVPKDTPSIMAGHDVRSTFGLAVVYTGLDADGWYRFYYAPAESIRHRNFPNEYKAWALAPYFQVNADPYP